MEKLVRVIALVLMLVVAGAHIEQNADANTITELHNIALNGSDAVSYTFFSVTTAGLFNIAADGQPDFTLANPQIYLFTDNGSPGGALTGTLLDANDDSGVGLNPLNSLIANVLLNPGNYVVAVGAFFLELDEARNDGNSGCCSGTVQVSIASEQGVANLAQVPEPASFILVGLGLLGLRFARRRG